VLRCVHFRGVSVGPSDGLMRTAVLSGIASTDQPRVIDFLSFSSDRPLQLDDRVAADVRYAQRSGARVGSARAGGGECR
jgi:hypothetical protein